MKKFTQYYAVITALAVILLILLAGMQYKWLTEISQTQKNRLQNQMQSGAKSFSTEFNKLFSNVGSSIDLLGNEQSMKEQLHADYNSWLAETKYPELLEKIYLIPPSELDNNGALAYHTGSGKFRELTDADLKMLKTDWQFESKKQRINQGAMLFLGAESMIIKRAPQTRTYFEEFIDLMDTKDNLRSFLANEIKTSFIVLKLNNDVIQQKILPDFYKNFFGPDYSEQFNLVIKNQMADNNYHLTYDEPIAQAEPEVVQRIGELELQSFVILFANKSTINSNILDGEDAVQQVVDSTLKKVSKTTVNSLKFSFSNKNSSNILAADSLKIIKPDTSDSLEAGHGNSNNNKNSPISIQTKTKVSPASTSLRLEVFMKGGDLEAYITKTKWKNMGLSLSILIILGMAFGLISYNARASQKLADQQMMFVAGISHELKTPISVINSAAENLQDGLIRKPQKMEEYGKLIHKEGNRLNGMVNQVMQLAELQSDQMEIHKEKVALRTLIDRTKKQMNALLDETDTTLEYYEQTGEGDLTLRADPEMMVQVLANLISNAIKYRSDDNRIIIRARKQDENKVEISVQDFGLGIPNHEQQHVFNPFYRGSTARKRQIQGNGLGLYITQQLIKRHNGHIDVESTPQKGTTFIIQLPIHKED